MKVENGTYPMTFNSTEATEILSRTPGTLRAMLSGLSEEWTKINEGGKTWSAFDVVGHLIHGEETDWIPRLRIILTSGESAPFPPFDRGAQFRKSEGKSLSALLDEFGKLRMENISVLKQIFAKGIDLDRRGMHPELGSVTIRELLATWVVHDLDHLAQIARTMAKRYGEDVGPWERYLGILDQKKTGAKTKR
jgi:hypothetical protein